MARQFIVLCEGDLKKILDPKRASAPEADPHPVVAGTLPGPYASAEIAEQQIMNYNCRSKHFIVELKRWRRLSL